MTQSSGFSPRRDGGLPGGHASLRAVLALMLASASWAAQTAGRERVSFNADWRFARGDPDGSAGKLPFLGIGWYRKHFIVKEEDPTRPTTVAMNWAKPDMPLPGVADVISLNYQGEGIRDTPEHDRSGRIRTPPQYPAFREALPDKVILSSENAAALSTCGTYLFPVIEGISAPVKDGLGGDSKNGYVTAYELHAANPIMPGADPHAMVLGDTVWIYPTWSPGRGERFFAFSSTDLVNWQRHGPVLDFKDVSWIKDDGQERHHAWAPAVLAKDGKYYFYYSVGPQNPTPSRIGVAVGDAPGGPFRDSGQPLLTGGNGFEAIDPMVFVDPRSGKTYLYAGGSAGAKLRVFELSPDRVSLAGEIPVSTPPKFTEGAFMHYHDGRYYLSYSHGGWQHSSYSVHYATAETPTGPWTYRGPILTSDATRKGPGHHSFIRTPLTGPWRIVYHRWENQAGDGPYRGSRQICIDDMEYDPNGLIRPIVMTGQDGGSR